jgi:hypothetical protein
MENSCAQVAILDRERQMPACPSPEDGFLGATDPCAGRPMNPRSGSSDECRKSSQRPTTACVQGYSGDHPHMERYLDSKGKLNAFVAAGASTCDCRNKIDRRRTQS